jgi:hypothetical protein
MEDYCDSSMLTRQSAAHTGPGAREMTDQGVNTPEAENRGLERVQ